MKSEHPTPSPTAPQPTSVTNPLGLRQMVPSPSSRIDWLPFADLALIVLLVVFFSSRFLFVPGISLDLPPAGEQTTNATPDAVATVYQGRIITPAGIYSLDNASVAFRNILPSRSSNPVLLLLLDRSTPVETLTEVTRQARSAGFERIHLGTREPVQPTP